MGNFTKQLISSHLVILIVVVLSIIAQRHNVAAHGKEEEEAANPLLEAAKQLIQDQLQNEGGGGATQGVNGILQALMQSDGGRNIGDLLLGAAKSSNGNAGDILSGLGSILAAAGQSKSNEGGIDPQLIGQMVKMFASQAMDNGDEDNNNNVDVNNNEIKKSKHKKKVGNNESPIDWESVIGLATNFMAAQGGQGGGGGFEGLLNVLPMLFGAGESSSEIRKHHNKHQQHKETSYLPPFMETLYDYWDHFKSSELGRTLWHNSGLESTVQLFTDEDGHFEMGRIFESLENASFRRRWIKALSSFVAEWIAHVSDPATQARYLTTLQFFGNGLLKSQGYNKASLYDPTRPVDSLCLMVNAVFKRQFGLKVNSATYIKPAFAYIEDVMKIGKQKGLKLSRLSSQDIESKLAGTLNGEVIEPLLRVWRAYQYGTRNPQCDTYVLCAVNQQDPAANIGSGLRPGITKLASITASWFLSSNTGTPFFKLYTAATEDHNCQIQYPVNCNEYHEEDIKATTEYSHSEL